MSKGADTRSEILTHALALSSRVGLEGLTIGSLASAVGMTKSGVYAHFASKEALQLAVLERARDVFVERVVVPALRAPRGQPRLTAMLEAWLLWGDCDELPGGCPFIGAAAEYDDRPGAVRDALVTHQGDLVGLLENTAAAAVREGQFRADLDVTAFAQETYGIILGYYHFSKLLEVPESDQRARGAFQRLVTDASAA